MMKVDANFLQKFLEAKIELKSTAQKASGESNSLNYLFDVPPESGDEEPMVVLTGTNANSGTKAGKSVVSKPVDNRSPYEKIQDLGLSDEVTKQYFDEHGNLNEGYSDFKDLGPGSDTKTIIGIDSETGEDTTFELHRSWQKHFSVTKTEKDGTTRDINFYVDDKGNAYVDDPENKALMTASPDKGIDKPMESKEMSPGMVKRMAVEQMKDKGYTDEMLNTYFDYVVNEDKSGGFALKPQYSSVADMGKGKDTKGEYNHRFVFTHADNKNVFDEVKIYADGTSSTVTLARQKNDYDKQNATSKAAINPETLKEMGLSDDIIAKYFNHNVQTSGGTYVQLSDGYSDMQNKGPGKDPVTGQDCKNILVFTKEYENGQKELEYVYIHTDGTNAARGSGSRLTSDEIREYQETQKNNLVKQGYTPDMIDKYFEYMVNGATGKGGYSLKPEYENVKDHGAGKDFNGKDYTHKFVFGLNDGNNGDAEEVIVYPDGTVSVSRMTRMHSNNNDDEGFRGLGQEYEKAQNFFRNLFG